MPKKTQTIKSPEQMREFARGLGRKLENRGRGKRATVLLLSGELGSGKTTFVRELARVLGVSDRVASPTFVIEKRYRIPRDGVFDRLIHIDAYRLSGEDVDETLDFAKTLEDSRNLIAIEWPENLDGQIQGDLGLFFEFVDENTRRVKVGGLGVQNTKQREQR